MEECEVVVRSKYFLNAPMAPPPPPSPPTPLSASPAAPPADADTGAADLKHPPIKTALGHPPVLVFDVETTGLKPLIVCQLAYLVIENGAVSKTYDEIFKLPTGVVVEERARRIHKISTLDCETLGVDPTDALETFAREASRVVLQGGRLVAHNANFDTRAINTTRLAHDIIPFGENQDLDVRDTFCSMQRSRKFSPLKDKANKTKPFSNEELYEFLYDEKPTFATLHRCRRHYNYGS